MTSLLLSDPKPQLAPVLRFLTTTCCLDRRHAVQVLLSCPSAITLSELNLQRKVCGRLQAPTRDIRTFEQAFEQALGFSCQHIRCSMAACHLFQCCGALRTPLPHSCTSVLPSPAVGCVAVGILGARDGGRGRRPASLPAIPCKLTAKRNRPQASPCPCITDQVVLKQKRSICLWHFLSKRVEQAAQANQPKQTSCIRSRSPGLFSSDLRSLGMGICTVQAKTCALSPYAGGACCLTVATAVP